MNETYTDQDVIAILPTVKSLRQLLIKLLGRSCSLDYRTIKSLIVRLNLDTSHFDNEVKIPHANKPLTKKFKDRLKESRGGCCEKCKLGKWLDESLVLEIHHIDGNRLNHCESNLQVLCPNCHSQTPNWKMRGKGKRRIYDKAPSKTSLGSLCLVCSTKIGYLSSYCADCFTKKGIKLKFRVTKEELEKLIQELPFTKIGEMYGVTGNAVKKRAQKLGIVVEDRRGYWSKKNNIKS